AENSAMRFFFELGRTNLLAVPVRLRMLEHHIVQFVGFLFGSFHLANGVFGPALQPRPAARAFDQCLGVFAGVGAKFLQACRPTTRMLVFGLGEFYQNRPALRTWLTLG